jgi:hypothetical protein
MRPIEGVAIVVSPDFEGYITLAKLDRVPQVIIDDSEFGNLNDLPEVLLVGSSHSPPGLWILDVGATVPFEPTRIERVV